MKTLRLIVTAIALGATSLSFAQHRHQQQDKHVDLHVNPRWKECSFQLDPSLTQDFHANGMRFTALDADGAELASRQYYSVGGGFVVSDEVAADGALHKVIAPDTTVLPYPFRTGDELLQRCREHGLSIAGVMRSNERHWRNDEEVRTGLLRIWDVMQACVQRGCATHGVLPGGFKVRRRAPALRSTRSSR